MKQSEDYPLPHLWRQIPQFGLDIVTDQRLGFSNKALTGQEEMLSWRKTLCIIQSHAEHSQPATTGAADRLVINERRQREGEKWTEGKNREKERVADSSPPPLGNQGGEDTEGRRRRERRTYASSSAARQPNHYITRVFKLTWCMLCIVVDLHKCSAADSVLPAWDVTPLAFWNITRVESMIFSAGEDFGWWRKSSLSNNESVR